MYLEFYNLIIETVFAGVEITGAIDLCVTFVSLIGTLAVVFVPIIITLALVVSLIKLLVR